MDSRWQNRSCPACTLPNAKLFFYKESVPFVECEACKTVYVNPLPPEDLLIELYEEYGHSYFVDEAKLVVDFNPDRYRREMPAIPQWARHGSLLDVGCATGSFLCMAHQFGFTDVYGIDVSSASVDYANRKLGQAVVMVGNFLNGFFEADKFDIVTLWATLEHVTRPEAFIRESYRVLKKGGLLCISVPNRNGLSFRGLGPKSHQVSLEHLNYFTPQSLRHLLVGQGFLVLKTWTLAFNPLIFWKDYHGRHVSTQFGMADLIKDASRNAALRRNPLIHFAERVVDFALNLSRIGDLLIVTAQKT